MTKNVAPTRLLRYANKARSAGLVIVMEPEDALGRRRKVVWNAYVGAYMRNSFVASTLMFLLHSC